MSRATRDSIFELGVVTDEEGHMCLNDDGSEMAEIVTNFHLRWNKDHFDQSIDHYMSNSGKLDLEDQRSYDKLVKFVNGLFPAPWEIMNREVILDEQGQPIYEARYINTKELLEYDTIEDALLLLGVLFSL